MPRTTDNAITTAVLALASGALLGAAAALLLAPAAGRETRRKLVDLQEDTSNKLKKYASETRHRISSRKDKTEDLHYDGGDAWI